MSSKHKHEHHHEHHHGESCGCAHEHHHDGDACACGHEHAKETKVQKYLLIASAVLFLLSFIKIAAIPVIVYNIILVISAVAAAYPVAVTAVKHIIKGDVDENVLMTIAVIAAMALGEFAEAAAVAIFFRVGEALEETASKRSRNSIRSLSEIQADTANIITPSNDVESVKAESVEVGSTIVIYPHERVPLDCVVIHGQSMTDASAITGESMPVAAEEGSKLLSGTINGNETLIAKTTDTLEESTASRIIKMVETASAKKGRTQKIITRIAAYYTPAVVALALIVAVVPSLITGQWAVWIYRALALLVASCPCALVLSVPLGFFTSMGTAARKGILVKGSKYIEETAKANCVIFDKTGTLTTDTIKVSNVFSPVGLDSQAVLLLAAAAESHSTHPIAKAIKEAAPEIDSKYVSDFKEIPGHGASAVFAGKEVLCGSKKLFKDNGIDCAEYDGVLVALSGRLVGVISLEAEIRPDAEEAIKELRSSGIGHIAMLTGDNEESARAIAKKVDIDEYYAELLPGDKIDMLEKIRNEHGKVIYVGDGINDAPVLAAANVGVGMGFGSQAANEAADMVLTNNSLSKLAQARKLAAKTVSIVKGNIIFIMAVKIIILILCIIGVAPMWLAVFADVGVCLISVIISSMIASDDIKSALQKLIKPKR